MMNERSTHRTQNVEHGHDGNIERFLSNGKDGPTSVENCGAIELIRWTVDMYHHRVALASSFGAEDIDFIDLFSKISARPRVFMLDTGRLQPGTYKVMEEVECRYNLQLEVYFPDGKKVEEMVQRRGINPLADWTDEKVWRYICTKGLPYNELHDRNYPTIGCPLCSRSVRPGEDPRTGRWWWENSEKECGSHEPQDKVISGG